MQRDEQQRGSQVIIGMITVIVAFLIFYGQPIKVQAQSQWTTNGNDISNTNSGNVGIGTNPLVKLDVYSNNGANMLANEYFGTVRISKDTGGQGGVVFGYKASDTGGVIATTGANSYLTFLTNNGSANAEVMRLTSSGNVGIGTTSPNQTLTINGYSSSSFGSTMQIIGSASAGAAQNQLNITSTANTWGLILGQNNSGVGSSLYHCANCAHIVNFNNAALVFGTNNTDRMRIDGSGNVGIGTATPIAKLDVNGNINVSGNINAKFQDVAEWVPAVHALPAGTVVVLNPNQSNQVMASATAYDTRVAGVVSEHPGVALGEASQEKVLVATTGRVKVKVDATRSPIHVGDLLVTSDKEGVAMKSEPVMIQGRAFHSPGTLIGKALEPLEKSTGEILVLLSLQ